MTSTIQYPCRQQRKKRFQPRKHIILHTALILVLLSASLDGSVGATDASEPVCTTAAATDCSIHKNDNNDNNNNSKNHVFAARRLDHGVLEWIASQPGAYYNPKQYMDEREGLVGIFATAPIAKGELLCRIPWEWTFHGDLLESSQLSCPLVKHLQRHLELGESSKYAPYIQYLKNQPNHQLVSAWSKAGQDLILRILGQTREENNDPQAYGGHPYSLALHMPPELVTNWLDGEYRKFCKGDEAGYKAALLALMRADDSIMIPGYDFYNHRNGHWHNADTEILWNTAHESRATRDIQRGEQIFISYNRCSDCGQRHDWYGTAEMFRDYGFIENFPQRWHYFNSNEVDFELHDKGNHTYLVEWFHQPESNDDVFTIIAWLKEQVRRLERAWYVEYHHRSVADALAGEAAISEFEWNMTWAFQQANLLALRAAIEALSKDPTRERMIVSVPPYDAGDNYDDLPVDVSDLYHPLDYRDDTWRRIDAEVVECSKELDDYDTVERYSGFLQQIEISEADMDICLERNGYVHVCSSFRPMYYEYFVHPATSLLRTMKRVLIMGNGATFLLHEIMKYDSTLEFVMVLEPDSAVTRLSQKHFGVDPHWHDPRVQWWFGNVGAVLTLLSNDQWTSFDLVLIDLPRAGLEGTFRNGITALDLVHERGIVVSRTSEWHEFSNLFDYTARMAYEPTSGCTLVWTVGSPSIDFMRAPANDHVLKGSLLLYEPNLMTNPEGRHKVIHEWQSGPAATAPGQRPTSKSEHIHEPLGVLEVLELGGVNGGNDLEACVMKVKEALKQIDQEIISTTLLSSSNAVFMTLQRGYIIMRSSVPNEFVGVDISWSRDLGSLSSIKGTIVKALSASVLSAYRLVSNGHIPPAVRIPKPRTYLPVDGHDLLHLSGEVDQSTLIRTVMSEMGKTFILPSQRDILVVCESRGQCEARDIVSDMSSTKTVHVLELCAQGGDTSDQKNAELLECERRGRDWLKSTTAKENFIARAIVLDGNLSKSSLQVFDALVNTTPRTEWGRWIRQGTLLVALPSSSGILLNAHRVFSDRFQQIYEGMQRPNQDSQAPGIPVLAEFSLFPSAARAVEVGVVVQGGEHIVASLLALESRLREMTAHETQLRLVQGGPSPDPSHHTDGDQDFDQTDYESRPRQALPSAIQAFAHAEPSDVPISLSVVADEIGSVLESMDTEYVRAEASSQAPKDTVIFQFEHGSCIVSQHDTVFAFNLLYACSNGMGGHEPTTKKPCTPEYAVDLVRRVFDEGLIDLSLASLDFVPRGPSPNMVFSRRSLLTKEEYA